MNKQNVVVNAICIVLVVAMGLITGAMIYGVCHVTVHSVCRAMVWLYNKGV